jgi:DNA-binding XRE family transcriptional regulator
MHHCVPECRRVSQLAGRLVHRPCERRAVVPLADPDAAKAGPAAGNSRRITGHGREASRLARESGPPSTSVPSSIQDREERRDRRRHPTCRLTTCRAQRSTEILEADVVGRPARALTPEKSARHRFGAELRRWRTERGLTHDALGRLVWHSAESFAKVEKGRRWPSWDLTRRVRRCSQGGDALTILWPAVEQQRLACDRRRRPEHQGRA